MFKSLKDKNGKEIVGSFFEKTFIDVGGIRQGFFIQAENPENPVILFLHGGPGNPILPLLTSFELPERLEKYFTLCYWDQRGAGMSFSKSIDLETMTVDQMLEDTRQMTEYLQKRFNQEKIYLMGHSWGSFLGIKTIAKYPENYLGYIGIGQVANQVESEKLTYDHILQHAIKKGDRSAIKKISKFEKDVRDFVKLEYILGVRARLMNKYNLGAKDIKIMSLRVLKDFLFFKGYTFSEKINYSKGALFSIKHLWEKVIKDNLFETSKIFKVPIYFIQGKYDYQTSYTVAYEYFDIIEAPKKEFYAFDNSAHFPMMEEREKFVEIVRKIANDAIEN